jgi:hypothetical protein
VDNSNIRPRRAHFFDLWTKSKFTSDYNWLEIEGIAQAINRISDEEILFAIAARVQVGHGSESKHSVRLQALARITDLAFLGRMLVTADCNGIRSSIVSRLTDQQLLRQIAKNDKDSSARSAAVERVDDQSLLEDLARTDESAQVRSASFKRIQRPSQALVEHLAKNESEWGLRRDAILLVADQALLADIEANAKDRNARDLASIRRPYAVALLKDMKLLDEIARDRNNDIDVRQAALQNLTSPDHALQTEIAEILARKFEEQHRHGPDDIGLNKST